MFKMQMQFSLYLVFRYLSSFGSSSSFGSIMKAAFPRCYFLDFKTFEFLLRLKRVFCFVFLNDHCDHLMNHSNSIYRSSKQSEARYFHKMIVLAALLTLLCMYMSRLQTPRQCIYMCILGFKNRRSISKYAY